MGTRRLASLVQVEEKNAESTKYKGKLVELVEAAEKERAALVKAWKASTTAGEIVKEAKHAEIFRAEDKAGEAVRVDQNPQSSTDELLMNVAAEQRNILLQLDSELKLAFEKGEVFVKKLMGPSEVTDQLTRLIVQRFGLVRTTIPEQEIQAESSKNSGPSASIDLNAEESVGRRFLVPGFTGLTRETAHHRARPAMMSEKWQDLPILDPSIPDPVYDGESGYKGRVSWGFCDTSEKFNGRAAMMGFTFTYVQEAITGKGVITLYGLPYDSGAFVESGDSNLLITIASVIGAGVITAGFTYGGSILYRKLNPTYDGTQLPLEDKLIDKLPL